MHSFRRASILLAMAIAGCATPFSVVDKTPPHWSDLDGSTVTVRGTAGNSEMGPIVRLADGGYIPLKTQLPWSIDLLGRQVDVRGQVISGAGFRAERYVIDPTSITPVPPPVKQ